MVKPTHLDLMAALADVSKSHEAIGQALTTHAERHAARLAELRSKLESEDAISRGIERHIAPK